MQLMLERLEIENFKVASAIIHYDETSPHLHIVGVPIKVGGKNGESTKVESNNSNASRPFGAVRTS